VDYAIHGKMCAHIHAACLRQREDEEVHVNISEPVTESQQVRETETEMAFHQNDIQRQSKPPHNTQADTIQKLTNEINSLVTTCNNNSLSNSSDLAHSTLNGVIEHLKWAKRLLEIYDQEVASYPVNENISQPVNKLMTPQKRYYSVRKKRTSKKSNLQKPSVEEAAQLEGILLQKDLLINTGDLDHDYETTAKVSSETMGCSNTKVLLTSSNTDCLMRQQMLDDNLINTALSVLKKQFHHISGLETPLLCQISGGFTQQKGNSRVMVQIHHTGSSQHWVTSVRLRGEDCVKVYDSLLHFDPRGSPAMSDDLVKQICHIYFCVDPQLTVLFPEMTRQVNGVDCGLFALATETDVCFGRDPSSRHYVSSSSVMRQHLLQCLQSNYMRPFPATAALCHNSCRVKFIDVICYCRQPASFDCYMVDCERCSRSFHAECIKYTGGIFICKYCHH